jgi:hypothetical protein
MRRMAKPFETAGLKNAIIAKDPPTKEEDPILVQRMVFGNTLCSQYDA